MATHYKGQRITELLNLLASMEAKLDHNDTGDSKGWTPQEIASAYTTTIIAKAKLLALQGELK